jgi:penicillin-binding protein 1C
VGVVWAARLELPAGALAPTNIASVRVQAADGTLLREVLSRPDGRARWVPLGAISPHLVQATLAGEDKRFNDHAGIDPVAVLRALLLAAHHGRVVSGASTLTMQLVRLAQPAPRTISVKLREMVLACKLERELTKEQILWQYLNRAPYGHGTFGVEAAARRYFGKPAAHLSLAESARLAALPRGPSGYDPYRHRSRLERRARAILTLMREQGRITAGAHRLALHERVHWQEAARPFLAPHLVRRLASDPRLAGATSIRTTIDLALQERVEAAAGSIVEQLAPRGVTNAAALVVENATGNVLAYVGSTAFFDADTDGQNDGTTALRQPGSTMKPFTYGLALEQGLTPATLLEDLPAHFPTERGDYAPRNYDNQFHGPVRLRVALGSSYNVPAVRTARRVGLQRLLDRLRAFGFSSLDQPARHYGLGLTLGNGEVTLHELVAGYAALARGGVYKPLRLVLEARTPRGRALSLPRGEARRVLERRAAHLVSHILSDPAARLPAFGPATVLEVGFPAAVKTGTSKDFRDNWTVGYTPEITVGVWVGNFDGAPMHDVSGITGAGPLWAEVIRQAANSAPAFSRPKEIVSARICPLSGALAGRNCPGEVEELFVRGTAPRSACDVHREIAIDRRNGLRAGPGCPEHHIERRALVVLPPPYRAWAHAQGLPSPPAESSPLCPTPPPRTAVSIRFPVEGDRYFVDADLRRSHQTLPLEATVEGSPREVRWLVDGELVARAGYPYSAAWPIHRGRHTIEAVLPDGQRSGPVTITVR